MTTVAIHQPQYLPWIPYCDKADRADVLVHLDTVQFHRGGVQNRNSVPGANGPILLSVPVSGGLDTAIRDVPIANDRWRAKHKGSLRQAYAKTRFPAKLDALVEIIERPWPKLVDLNVAVTAWMFEQLGLTTRTVRASELPATGTRDDLLVAICLDAGATRYLSGTGGRAYLDQAKFERHGIEVVYQAYEVQPYPQVVSAPFDAAMSAVDLILCMGPEAGAVMRAGRRPLLHHDELPVQT